MKSSVKKVNDVKEVKINGELDEEMTSPEIVSEPPTFNKKKMILGVILGAVATLVLLLVIFTVLFYRAPGKYPLIDRAAYWLNLPVASADGQFVKYRDFDYDYQKVKYYYDQQVATKKVSPDQIPTESQMRTDTLNQLIKNTVTKQLGLKYDLSIADIEVESAWQNEVVKSFKDEAEAIKTIKDYYGMDVEEYKEKVLRLTLLSRKVADAINVDKKIQDDFQTKAQGIYDKLKSGEKSFEDLAKEYSDDTTTKDQGGEMDWLTHQDMTAVPEIDQAAFSLEKDKYSDLLKTSYGYYIIKLVDKKAASEDGKTPEQVKLKDIYVRTGLAGYLEAFVSSDKVHKYVSFTDQK